MRIRKHAARIFSSLSIPTRPCAAAATAAGAAASAAGGRELDLHVCELNQSPWDAMAFTPSEAAPLYHYQEGEDAEEENGFFVGATWGGQREVLAAAVSDVSGITATRSTWSRQTKIEEMAEGAEEAETSERKIEPKKWSSNHNTKKINKRKTTSSCATEGTEVEKVKMEVESAATATSATTCKKSDGKGWHCKRAAQRPHSLCEYHLTQVRSYYTNGGSTAHVLLQQQSLRKMHGGGIVDARQVAALIPDKKDVNEKTSRKKDNSSNGAARRTKRKPAPSDFYYYYSGFGPWRGKRRSGGAGDREVSVVDPRNGDDDGGGAYDGVPPASVHDQGPDDLDDDDDDTDGLDDVVATKRRGRKPIKARSLKSLL